MFPGHDLSCHHAHGVSRLSLRTLPGPALSPSVCPGASASSSLTPTGVATPLAALLLPLQLCIWAPSSSVSPSPCFAPPFLQLPLSLPRALFLSVILSPSPKQSPDYLGSLFILPAPMGVFPHMERLPQPVRGSLETRPARGCSRGNTETGDLSPDDSQEVGEKWETAPWKPGRLPSERR